MLPSYAGVVTDILCYDCAHRQGELPSHLSVVDIISEGKLLINLSNYSKNSLSYDLGMAYKMVNFSSGLVQNHLLLCYIMYTAHAHACRSVNL